MASGYHIGDNANVEYFHHHRKFHWTMLLWASNAQTIAFRPNTVLYLLSYGLQVKNVYVFLNGWKKSDPGNQFG